MPTYDELPEETKAGISREVWESWTPEQQLALLDPNCIEPDCENPRWQKAGSFYCEEHAGLYSLGVYDEHGELEEEE
ncbi:MAG: hypothetical protein J2P57_16905 [Acidimicrobiaceae bacterium]|nr:hypothetical protein [Acidimicrobiaceae bacterium]